MSAYIMIKCSCCGEKFRENSEEYYWHIKIDTAKTEQAYWELNYSKLKENL